MEESTQVVETQPETEAQVAPEVGSDGEEFDAARAQALIKKLRDEAKVAKTAQKELATLKAAEEERKEAELSELEKANKRAAELEAELNTTKLREMRNRIGAEAKLPSEIAALLQGETEEAMKEHAAKLVAALPKSATLSPTNPGNVPAVETRAQKKARLTTNESNIFGSDPQSGVIWPQEVAP